MMKISIVTISYNQAAYLEQAICSVLDQNYSNIEYIVVDPGSTDGSRSIIEKYRERISKIIFEPDNGPADGLNKGFSHATGEILGYLNADDMLMPGAVSRIVHAFEKNSRIDVISGHGYFMDASGRVLRPIFSNRFGIRRYAYGVLFLVQQATFFKRVFFNKTAGFNVHNRISWDGELWVNLALAGAKFARIHNYLALFRIYDQSITGSYGYKDKLSKERQRIRKKIGVRDPNTWLWTFLYFLDRVTDPQIMVLRILDIKENGLRSLLKFKQ